MMPNGDAWVEKPIWYWLSKIQSFYIPDVILVISVCFAFQISLSSFDSFSEFKVIISGHISKHKYRENSFINEELNNCKRSMLENKDVGKWPQLCKSMRLLE